MSTYKYINTLYCWAGVKTGPEISGAKKVSKCFGFLVQKRFRNFLSLGF